MLTYFLAVALAAMFNTGLLLLAIDWQIDLKVRQKIGHWCEFCIGFWLSVIELLILCWYTGEGFLFVLPLALCAATLTRRLI